MSFSSILPHVEAVRTRLVKDLRRAIPLEERVEHFFSRHEAWTQASEPERAYILAGCDPSAGRRLRTHSPDQPLALGLVFIDGANNQRAMPS